MSSSTPAATASGSYLPTRKHASFPFLDLRAQFESIREDILLAVTRVLESQQLILGPEVTAFENEIADLLACKFAVSCASGSDALLLALMVYGIGPGDEVITTPFTFFATAGCIARLGARPVFVDIHPLTYNLDPGGLEAAITPRTRAILPVHLFGLPAEMASILEIAQRRDLPVIEDAAQAIGATYRDRHVGTWGQVGCFSFFPSKNLGGAGDGGMLTTNDAQVADQLRLLRQHGSREKYRYEVLGVNSRLDALQASILRVKLKHLPEWTASRQRNADRYRSLLADHGLGDTIVVPRVSDGCLHVYNQFVVRMPHREELRFYLRQRGIPTEIYYPVPLHLQPAFRSLAYCEGDFPAAEQACSEVLALPIYPELTEAQQRLIVDTIAEFIRAADHPSRSFHAND